MNSSDFVYYKHSSGAIFRNDGSSYDWLSQNNEWKEVSDPFTIRGIETDSYSIKPDHPALAKFRQPVGSTPFPLVTKSLTVYNPQIKSLTIQPQNTLRKVAQFMIRTIPK